MEAKWLEWAKKMQAISQAGLEYSNDKFDIERFEQIRELSIEIMSNYTDLDNTKVRSLFANEKGYQTPKVDIRAAIFNDDKILLVKEKIDDKWSLPGGWADIGLSVYENAIKESFEEAGATVRPKRVIAVLDRSKHIDDLFPYSVYKIFVECDYVDDKFNDNIETIDSGFFPIDNLPTLSVQRNTESQIRMCFEARAKASLEAICD